MATLLRMPGVSADSDEATLAEWHVHVGQSVARGDVIASIETDKAVVDIEADAAGVVHTLLADAHATIAVGEPIAVVLASGEDDQVAFDLLKSIGRDGASAGEPPEESIAPAPLSSTDVAEAEDMQAPDEGPKVPDELMEDIEPVANATEQSFDRSDPARDRVFASPLARRLAFDYGLDIAAIPGTGPVNRVTKKDVEAARAAAVASASEATATPSAEAMDAAAQAQQAAPTVVTEEVSASTIPHSKLRRMIAERLQSSTQTAPHWYLKRELVMDALLEFRDQVNDASDMRHSVNDFVVKAVALALRRVPEVNVNWTDTAMVQFSRSDVAVAVASDRGLVTPVVRGADTISLSVLSSTVRDYAQRANEGRLQQQELEGGAFTVSNLGMYDVDEFSAIINPPHAGIVAVGTATKRPALTTDGELTVATMCSFTFSFDHRAVDGALGARFAQSFADLITHPLQLLL